MNKDEPQEIFLSEERLLLLQLAQVRK